MNLGRREIVIIATALGLLLVGTGVYWWRAQANTPVVIASPPGDGARGGTTNAASPVVKPEQVVVHISGAVRQPGLYSLPLGSRLNDAIQVAGGALAEGDLDAVNLAAPLVDGQKYTIPVKGQPTVAVSSDGIPSGSSGSSKININTADAKTLEQLPGIGEVRAKAIIEYRQKNGPFRSIEDLKKISGIGEKTFEQMRDQVTIN